MDVKEIQKLLAHRYPFLLVDRVLEIEIGKKLVGFKNVTINEEFFQGHFPGHPVMPGVLILEALAQACALLAYKSSGLNPEDLVIYLMAIDNAKFRKPVVPGDRLTLTAEVVRVKGVIWKQRGVATVDGAVVAEADFLATAVKKGQAAL
ncbi:MAG: 3-hydroxyacyl-ACP dehydratase FabZ [Archangium sp.]|nr:3-hydroxyacyl-ACP dehydratase FabZ [Archangium sp.]MDP3151179.1 3-hydroxyacyl-ACP dehydratase FabZ [Archangium sp.]MDP3570180.1 3-hydroxyacyl-ACP dehydratase FabZ [Archangium sp.]